VTFFKVVFQQFREGNSENHVKPVRIIGIRTEFWTRDLSNNTFRSHGQLLHFKTGNGRMGSRVLTTHPQHSVPKMASYTGSLY
jgi:hypothetical protein